MNKTQIYKKFGGNVIASGGFGCVFNPALKCKGKNRENNKISKLMTKKHALDEYNEIESIKKKLDNIPNYEKYFLVDNFTICVPDKLTEYDLENYEKKCTALPKDNITKENINNSLHLMMALNMPNGGIPVDDYIYDDGSFDKLIPVNVALINLLNYGILPMNKENIYHCDIKDSNVLVNNVNGVIETKLIDWGLSTIYIPHKFNEFPRSWRNRPLQFNVPFSTLIFTDLFFEKYTKYIKNGGKISYVNLKPFILDYIYVWIKKRGAGHYKLINSIMYMLFSNEFNNIDEKTKIKLIETEYTLLMIANYIIEILIHFTKFRENGDLNFRDYLDNVFIKITDIWGFIMVYFPIVELLFNNYDKLNQNQLKIFNHLKHIILVYCYNPRTMVINMESLNKDFKTLSNLLENEKLKTTSNVKNQTNTLSTAFKKHSVTGQTFHPIKSSSSYFIKQKISTSKKIKNLILVPNKNKTKKAIKHNKNLQKK
jgi:hypothetical protein